MASFLIIEKQTNQDNLRKDCYQDNLHKYHSLKMIDEP